MSEQEYEQAAEAMSRERAQQWAEAHRIAEALEHALSLSEGSLAFGWANGAPTIDLSLRQAEEVLSVLYLARKD